MVNAYSGIITQNGDRMDDIEKIDKVREARERILDEIHKVIVGQENVIEEIMVSLLTGGHSLLLGVPGLAKTLLVNTLANALSLSFQRIQFTPDLMPSDITGTEILEEMDTGKREFRFLKGPIFANIILADEINRTPPKTQAALLQAMQEYKVTVGGETYRLDMPFFVLATRNPIEQEGTYPLPEAQLDRFMFEIVIDYPKPEEEVRIVETTTSAYIGEAKPVIGKDEILELQNLVRRVPVSVSLLKDVVKFVGLTRPSNDSSVPRFIKDWVAWGASPRASQYIILGAKAKALFDGRPTPSIEDVKFVLHPVLRHRLILNFAAEADNITVSDVIDRLIREAM